MADNETLLISKSKVQSLLAVRDCMESVEDIFLQRSMGKVSAPGILGIHASSGGFHIKAGIAKLKRNYFVSKTNANFPNNKSAFGLPTIQGVIVVSDADNGRLLALMDSIEVTIIRTGAATGVAAKYLSRPESKVVLICGCGNQGYISVRCILEVRQVERVYLFDIDLNAAASLSKRIRKDFQVSAEVADSIPRVSKMCDIIVTCTPSKKYFLGPDDVSPGTFIAAIGSDSEYKNELDPALLTANKVVTDSTDQCVAIGELHHAINAGIMTKLQVHAELGEVIAGIKAGRQFDNEIIIFDSTGTALQDIAAAAIVYENALLSNSPQLNFAE